MRLFLHHFSYFKKLFEKDKKCDSHARNFVKCHVKNLGNKHDVRKVYRMGIYEILWRGKEIPSVKTFSTIKYKLFLEDKLAILNAQTRRFNKKINKKKELFLACRHGGSFHELYQVISW